MIADTLSPGELNIGFDELRKILTDRGPRKSKFLKSTRCKVLVITGSLITTAIVALLATTYTIAFTTTTANTKTSSPTTSTTRVPSYQKITQLSDPVVAIHNASAGEIAYDTVPGKGTGNYPPGQVPTACVDFADTTYLNYDTVGYNISSMTNTAGVGTGVYTIPQMGASTVQSIQFQAGNSSAERDPLHITLEDSNATGTNLYSGSSWTLLYTGPTGLAPFNITRLAWGDLQNFTNT